MKAFLVIAMLAGCGGTTTQTFVRSIVIEQRFIVVEKCPLEYSGDEMRRVDSGCTTERLPIPRPAVIK